MAQWLFTLVALCLMSACGGDSSPTGVGDNSSGEAENRNDGPIFEENNTSLVVVAVEAPDTLFSGSQPVMFAATVQDSNQFAGQIEVAMRLRRGDEVWTLSRQDSVSANTARFGAMFDSTLAAGFLGNQTLQFQAVDASAGGSKMLTKEIYLENEAPILFEADTPIRWSARPAIRFRCAFRSRTGKGWAISIRSTSNSGSRTAAGGGRRGTGQTGRTRRRPLPSLRRRRSRYRRGGEGGRSLFVELQNHEGRAVRNLYLHVFLAGQGRQPEQPRRDWFRAGAAAKIDHLEPSQLAMKSATPKLAGIS